MSFLFDLKAVLWPLTCNESFFLFEGKIISHAQDI